MCEASAYLLKNNEEILLMEAVDTAEPEGDKIRLVNIFGEQKIITGEIYSLSLVDHKIFIREKTAKKSS